MDPTEAVDTDAVDLPDLEDACPEDDSLLPFEEAAGRTDAADRLATDVRVPDVFAVPTDDEEPALAPEC